MSRLVFLFCLLWGMTLTSQSVYDGQIAAIEQLLARGRYAPARSQSEALVQSGREAQLPEIEYRGEYLLGRSLLEDSEAEAEQRVRGIRALQRAANGFRIAGQVATVDSIVRTLRELTGKELAEIADLPTVRELRKRQGATAVAEELEETALGAIVALQQEEIEALNDSQVRQLLRIQQQELEIDRYEFEQLSDSLLLLQQRFQLDEQRELTRSETQRRNFLLVISIAVLAALGLLYSRYRSGQRYQRQLREKSEIIEAERQRSDELLLNILPAEVAQELKHEGVATARRYESVTVLFSDFVGFSAIAGQFDPKALVQMLDETFRAFDEIIGRHGLEKIKTIGDAYMCAGGLPSPDKDHANRAVAAALEIQRYLARSPYFAARIGIHSGPVVAGVVGQKKFAYDIWGDTVNQAARLEADGVSGQVTISKATCDLLGDRFDCQHAGTFEAKNIGRLDRFVVTAVDEPAD